MSKTETPTATAAATDWPKQCGTATTPPCPTEALYIERNTLIYLLAGHGASKDRVSQVALHVDEYLLNSLRGAIALTRTTAEHPKIPG